MTDDDAVSDRIRAVLDANGVSERELGRRLDERHGWVQRRLRPVGDAEGHPGWGVQDVARVAIALGTSAEWLLTGRERD